MTLLLDTSLYMSECGAVYHIFICQISTAERSLVSQYRKLDPKRFKGDSKIRGRAGVCLSEFYQFSIGPNLLCRTFDGALLGRVEGYRAGVKKSTVKLKAF